MSAPTGLPGVVSIGDCLTEMVQEMARGPRRAWGLWRYDADRLVLVHARTGYEVDLERCTTSAQVLDWLVQITEKAWADDATIANLVFALDGLLALQATLCGSGVEHGPLNVRAFLAPRKGLPA